MLTKLKKLVQSLLPGIFLLGFNIGTGSVTAMAKAGADYGMSLLWTILISCAITFLLIHLYGKYTVITGETALEAFKKHIHPGIGIFFIVALGVNVSGSVIGVMGIIADACFVWSKGVIHGGIHPIYFALFFIAVVYVLFLDGRTRVFQNALAIMVAIMSLAFLINFFILTPPPTEVVKGLVPVIPNGGGKSSSFLIIASMVGTTVFSGLFIIRTTLVKEAGWTLKDLKIQRNDALFSAFMMFVISATIMAAAAGVLHTKGIRLENVTQMISILNPLAGPFAAGLFTIGLIAAGVSSQFPNVLLVPWLLCDFGERPRDMKRTDYRVIVLLISLLGLVVPIFHAKPILVMIASQAFGALILPVTVICLMYLGNKKSIMKSYSLSAAQNVSLILILAFSVTISYLAYSGLWNAIGSL